MANNVAAGGTQGRVAVKEIVDKSAEQDPEYARVVTEIREANTKSGWLIAAGAFDRQDLQYLQDFKEAERQKELDIHNVEAMEFAALRSRIEGSETGVTNTSTVHVAVREKKEMKPTAKLLPTVKVIHGKDNDCEPARKRSRTLSVGLSDSLASSLSREASVGSQQMVSNVPSRQTSAQLELWPPATANPGVVNAAPGVHGAGPTGLSGLLGGYGSSSDDDVGEGEGAQQAADGRAAPAQQQQQQQGGGSSGRLPNAAELLSDLQVQASPGRQAVSVALDGVVGTDGSSSGCSGNESGSESD